jgi:hypothetical protein
MQEIALKIVIAIVTKWMTETVMARVLIACLEAWAKTSENKLDDKVVQAMADALGVPVDLMPKAPYVPGSER